MRKFIVLSLIPFYAFTQEAWILSRSESLTCLKNYHELTLNSLCQLNTANAESLRIQSGGQVLDGSPQNHQIQYSRAREFHQFLVLMRHFGNHYFQEQNFEIAYGLPLTKHLKLGAAIGLMHNYQAEFGHSTHYSAELRARYKMRKQFSWLLACRHESSSNHLSPIIGIGSEFEIGPRLGFYLALLFAGNLSPRFTAAWHYQLTSNFWLQQKWSIQDLNSLEQAFLLKTHSWIYRFSFSWNPQWWGPLNGGFQYQW